MIPADSYNKGDKFDVAVTYEWNFYPVKDYTIKMYSTQDIALRNFIGASSVCHMDGTFPSCFTKSSYHIDSKESEIAEDEFVPSSLWNIFIVSWDWASFWDLVGQHPWTLLVWWWIW